MAMRPRARARTWKHDDWDKRAVLTHTHLPYFVRLVCGPNGPGYLSQLKNYGDPFQLDARSKTPEYAGEGARRGKGETGPFRWGRSRNGRFPQARPARGTSMIHDSPRRSGLNDFTQRGPCRATSQLTRCIPLANPSGKIQTETKAVAIQKLASLMDIIDFAPGRFNSR